MTSDFPRTIVAAIGLAFVVSAAHAQQTPQQAFDAANNLYQKGDYAAAVAAYDAVLRDYPTSPVVPNAQAQLALSCLLAGESQKSLDTLAKFFEGPPAGAELTELATLLRPQALAAKAAALKTGDPARQVAYREAVKTFNEFVQKYPKSLELESASYGSAVASFQLGDYEPAKTGLKANIQKNGTSPSIVESKNLLALILATEGSKMLSAESADRDAAFKLYDESSGLLQEVIRSGSDPVLATTAQFQLGEILLSEAAFAPDERKPQILEEARRAFRGVKANEDVIADQQRKIDALPARRGTALRESNPAARIALLNRVNREASRDAGKLEELRNRQDPSPTALQKVGESYFQEGKYDEARVVFMQVQPMTAGEDKKRNLYFTAMTYALQNANAEATAGYETFQSAYKSDPLAANLPVAMGNMFLNHPDAAVRNPEKAATYFKEAAELYPDSPLRGLSVVSEATARAQQGDFEGALKTYRDFLASNPPASVAAVAQLGIGNVRKDQGKWDEAIAAYKELVAKYTGTKQVEEGEFWIAVGTQQKGDNEAALPLISAFIAKYPDGALAPSALYGAASAQLALGRNDEGVATLAQIAEKFPNSQPAPFTYFQRAQIAGAAQNADEVVRLMREFAEKYPQDEKIYFAFDGIGQAENNRGNVAAAVAAYGEFAAKYAGNPKAAEAVLKTADLHRTAAERLGRFSALNPEDQAKWKESVGASLAAGEELTSTYPDSVELGLGLRSLLAAKKLEAGAGLTDATGVEKYFEQLAATASEKARSNIMFARAAFINDSDQARALLEMNKAYSASQLYAPADLELYGLALLAGGKTDEARAVFEKIAGDYPNPAGQAPSQAPPSIQEAQAISLFGLGRAAQEKGDVAGAGQLFEKLKTLYPWSPKVLEANYGIAASLRQQGKGEEAVALLTPIIRAPNASSQLRADAMLLSGYIQKDKSERDAAIDLFVKISAFYDGVPEAASTGLWEAGQLLEQQVNELQGTDPEKAKTQRVQMLRAYQELAEKFPASKYASQARERLAALGAAQ
jgi:TolA-binding protein